MKGGRTGLNEVASTPPPSTPPPPPDPNDYEKSVYKDRINEQDLDILKEQVRILKGLPTTMDKQKRKIDSVKPPKLDPRPTFTSRKRKELQQHRMLVRCANLKDKYREYEKEKQANDDDADEKFRQLRSEAMAKTNEDVNNEFELEELENLKTLATKAKEKEVTVFKETQGSRLRYKFNRGQPIISGNFRNAYDDYFKPPFHLCKDIYRPKIYNLPRIDKQKETWLIPVDDEMGIPLHRQVKSPDPDDRRSKKEKSRPPVRPGRRTPMSQWRSVKAVAPTKRPPWGIYLGCPLNVGSYK